jgi:hypothetical protein
MLPLMLGIGFDLFLVARFILANVALSAAVALVMLLIFFCLWYVLPWTQGLRRRASHRQTRNASSLLFDPPTYSDDGAVHAVVEAPNGSLVKLKHDIELDTFTVSLRYP